MTITTFTHDEILSSCQARIAEEGADRTAEDKGQDNIRDEIQRAAEFGQQGCAKLFGILHEGKFCYDHGACQWHEWRGQSWTREFVGEPVAALNLVADTFNEEIQRIADDVTELNEQLKNIKLDLLTANPERDAIAKSIESLERKAAACRKLCANLCQLFYRKQVVEFAAQGQNSLGFDGLAWDTAPGLLAVANGVLDLESGRLRPGRQKDYIKTASPVAYNPEAQAPTWDRFLLGIMGGDLELVDYLRRLFGYAATGLVREHVLPILHGIGRNGKGVLIETLSSVLGDLAAPVQAELLLDQGRSRSSAGPTSDIMALRGRRLAWASETNEGRKLDSSRVKWLVGGDTLVGRPPYGKYEITFKPTHTLLLLTNHKPHANADDFALWQRIHLIPFDYSFVDTPTKPNERLRDPLLSLRLQAEAQGILAWLVLGAREYLRDGLAPPPRVLAATAEYRGDEDLIAKFTDDCCVVDNQATCQANSLFEEYKRWTDLNKIRAMTGTAFGRRMGERFQKHRTANGVRYTGLGIRQKYDSDSNK